LERINFFSEELKKEIESGQINISLQPRGLVVSYQSGDAVSLRGRRHLPHGL